MRINFTVMINQTRRLFFISGLASYRVACFCSVHELKIFFSFSRAGKNCKDVRYPMWLAEPRIFIILPFPKKFSDLCVRLRTSKSEST